ncbi:hypothetical protein I598_1903 [Isoptericola dokdonensis DS-3]|uniref:Uncharacterized protein n=1 Tax=Isoptericola dokdonensis DS-3 TaxID=1300344 RepID=A0A168FDM1_9MICO|nr:hypothetical protein I598_1903 [Isoptericola dokdonensis DS-3]
MKTCGHTWTDGWGAHECHRAEHDDAHHSCRCDATTYNA